VGVDTRLAGLMAAPEIPRPQPRGMSMCKSGSGLALSARLAGLVRLPRWQLDEGIIELSPNFVTA